MKRWLAFVVALALTSGSHAATFAFRSTDAAGEGFNDPTPVTPAGGNTATTRGAARMNLMIEAGRIWGQVLQSNVTIDVDVSFSALTCSSNSGTLGQAGPWTYFRNFTSAPSVEIFYVSALAESIAGRNLSTGSNPDISAEFNSAVDDDSGCLGARGFYYGYDHQRGNRIDLLNVVLHELGHGLGFLSEVSATTGIGPFPNNRFGSFTHQLFDETLLRTWPAMTNAERMQSAVSNGGLAWNGSNANAQLGRYGLGGTSNGRFRMYAPTTVSGGSSVSHWDTVLTPSALMEPNLPAAIVIGAVDITGCALRDIGWRINRCPDDQVVNTAPVADSQSVTVAEEASIIITLTGSDADGNPLTFAISRAPSVGTLSAISTSTPRTVTYTPFTNFSGSDSFAFTVRDGIATSSPATVSVTVTPVNDPPVANAIDSSTQAGQSVGITLIGSDPDLDALAYAVVTSPSSGTLSGTAPTLVYQPNSGFVGTDTFTYRVNDGTTDSAAAVVSITVSAPPATNTASSGDSGGGGGGALGELWLALLVAVELIRRATRRADIG